jgi:hypothetical protein
MLRAVIGRQVLNIESTWIQLVPDGPSTFPIKLSGRIDAWNSHQFGGKIHDFVSGVIDSSQNSFTMVFHG